MKARAQLDCSGGGGVALVGLFLLLRQATMDRRGRWREAWSLRLWRLRPATSRGQDRTPVLDIGLSCLDGCDAS